MAGIVETHQQQLEFEREKNLIELEATIIQEEPLLLPSPETDEDA